MSLVGIAWFAASWPGPRVPNNQRPRWDETTELRHPLGRERVVRCRHRLARKYACLGVKRFHLVSSTMRSVHRRRRSRLRGYFIRRRGMKRSRNGGVSWVPVNSRLRLIGGGRHRGFGLAQEEGHISVTGFAVATFAEAGTSALG